MHTAHCILKIGTKQQGVCLIDSTYFENSVVRRLFQTQPWKSAQGTHGKRNFQGGMQKDIFTVTPKEKMAPNLFMTSVQRQTQKKDGQCLSQLASK